MLGNLTDEPHNSFLHPCIYTCKMNRKWFWILWGELQHPSTQNTSACVKFKRLCGENKVWKKIIIPLEMSGEKFKFQTLTRQILNLYGINVAAKLERISSMWFASGAPHTWLLRGSVYKEAVRICDGEQRHWHLDSRE